MPDTERPPVLTVVEEPDACEVGARLSTMRSQHEAHARTSWVGFLVTAFTNEELRAVADEWFNMHETSVLRKLGVLGPDEGFDGSPASRKRAAASQDARLERRRQEEARHG